MSRTQDWTVDGSHPKGKAAASRGPSVRVVWLLLVVATLPATAPLAATDVLALSHPAAFGLDAAALRDAYALGDLDGAGVRVAVVTWGPADESAFDVYAQANGLPLTNLTHHGDCSGPALDEWNLDVQMVKAAAPLADVHVHCAPTATFANLLAALDDAILGADVVSLSWGSCEPRVPDATADAFSRSFANASARGVAVFAASGDGGSRECTRWSADDEQVVTSWPAVDPRVVAVGGTRLESMDGAWDERAWNACAPCPGREWTASGGGVSLRHAAPYWQSAAMRESPDVAAVADRATGVEVHSSGRWLAMGGTSASTPFWAGAWAGLVAELGPLGPPGPLLYQAASAHRDIVLGSNGDHAAGPGRDLVTGWGAPQGAALLDALRALPPPPADLASARGPARGEVALSWTRVPGATGYVVLRGTVPGDEAPLAEVGDVASYVDAGLGDGTSWSYRVASQNESGVGPLGLPILGRTFSTPGAPEDLRWTARAGAVALAWDAPMDQGGLRVTYLVWRSTLLGEETLAGETDARSFVDEGCLGACAYTVSAKNRLGEGPRSEAVLAPGNAP